MRHCVIQFSQSLHLGMLGLTKIYVFLVSSTLLERLVTLRNTISPVSTICYEHLIERIFVSGNNCVSFEALPQASSPALLPSSPSCFSNLPLQPFLFPHPAFPQSSIPATFQRDGGCAEKIFVFTFSFLLTSPTVNFFFLALLCCASLLLILVDGRKDIALLNKDAPA